MSIGIIIFIISIIVSIIGAMSDNDHKKRQNQKPKPQPKPEVPKPEAEPKPRRSFLEEAYDEFKKGLAEAEEEERRERQQERRRERQDVPPQPEPETIPEYRQPQPQPKRYEQPTVVPTPSKSKAKEAEEARQRLEQELSESMTTVRHKIDREKEKQMAYIEREAREIIADKYLSERAKRYRLQELIQRHGQKRVVASAGLKFDEDEVVNGLIWSEILRQPKQVR